jgi:hypothetical protein
MDIIEDQLRSKLALSALLLAAASWSLLFLGQLPRT